MGDAVLRTLLYGLIAAISPLALASVLVVLKSERARLNGVLFALGFLLGGALVVLGVLAVGAAAPGSGKAA